MTQKCVDLDIVQLVKTQLLTWVGELERITKDKVPKRIMKGQMATHQGKSRPWNDGAITLK